MKYEDMTIDQLSKEEVESIKDRNVLYNLFKNSYQNLPDVVKQHREYFTQEGRGFGEDAFHAMWYYIFKHYQPKQILEIGVFRGQTLSLFQLLGDLFNIDVNVVGISPMASVGDSKSNYVDIDYEADILQNFDQFNLKHPKLVRAFSADANARYEIKTNNWDLIYIDGNHDYINVLIDYFNCVDTLNQTGIIVLDDSSLYTDFNVEGAFRGHEGPSTVVRDIVSKELDNFISVGHNNCFRIPPYEE